MNFPDALNDRTSLFKFAQRSGMHPYIFCIRVNVLLNVLYGTALSAPHLANLLAEDARNSHTNKIKCYDNVVHVISYVFQDCTWMRRLQLIVCVSRSSCRDVSKRLMPCAPWFGYACCGRAAIAASRRRSVSLLPRNAEISNMPGPLPSPTRHRRKAFMISPSLYSLLSIQAITAFS